jgi:hypothetical protein
MAPRSNRRSRGTGAALAGLLTLTVACGGGGKGPKELSGPIFRTLNGELDVAHAEPRGGYVEAVIAGEGAGIQTFSPDSPECRSVLTPGTQVRYVAGLMGGTFVRGDERCESAGIGSLAFWRDRRPRTPGPPLPRKQATFRAFYQDEDMILVRGRFPLGGEVGWSGGADSVAALPNTPECRSRAAEGVGSLEFHPSGPDALVLVTEAGPCPLLGLMRPLSDTPR